MTIPGSSAARFRLTDLSGWTVYEDWLLPGTHALALSGLARGVYVYQVRVQDKDASETVTKFEKLVVLR